MSRSLSLSLRRFAGIAVPAAVTLAACSRDSLEPIVPCAADRAVTISVSQEAAPRFTWRPACGMAHLWVVPMVDSLHGWHLRAANMSGNALPSGIRYGEVPDMAIEDAPAATLVRGVLYLVTLLRSPDGTNAYLQGSTYFTP
jgi:hypothetical protein